MLKELDLYKLIFTLVSVHVCLRGSDVCSWLALQFISVMLVFE